MKERLDHITEGFFKHVAADEQERAGIIARGELSKQAAEQEMNA